MNIEKMMQQAQAMQGKVQAELKAMLLTGSAGGGLVRIEMTGEKEVRSVTIDRSAVDPGDVETLQDLVLAALRDAARQVDEAVRQKTSAMLGGMLPGMR
jgi:DNA-binding YbaB/EbfC family protein